MSAAILGVIARLVPFFIRAASSSSEWQNGRLVSFVYRDPVAIAGGLVALACGLLIAWRLRRVRNGRAALAALFLLGAGVFHTVRGFGMAGVGQPPSPPAPSVTLLTPPPPAPARPEPAPPDLVAPTRRIFEAWRDDHAQQIYDGASPRFRAAASIADLQRLLDRFQARAGRYVDLLPSPTVEGADLRGQARFERGVLNYTMSFDLEGGSVALLNIHLNLPPEFVAVADMAGAEALARRMLDDLLAERRDALARLTVLEIRPAPLHDVTTQLGKVKRVTLKEQRPCDDRQCLTYDIVGTRNRGRGTFEVTFDDGAWEIAKFDVSVL